MNPRVLAVVGLCLEGDRFPIAKIREARDRYTADEIATTSLADAPRSNPPRLVVVKVPRFAFEKFLVPMPNDHDDEVGGRGQWHSPQLQRGTGQGLRSMEPAAAGFWTRPDRPPVGRGMPFRIAGAARWPLYTVQTRAAPRCVGEPRFAEASAWDPWFLDEIAGLVECGPRFSPRQCSTRSAATGEAGRLVGSAARRRWAEFAGEDGVRLLRHRLD